jgi:hypothetical protein
MVAALDELAGEIATAVASLDGSADALRTASDEIRIARWREWSRAAQQVFAAADRCWIAALPVLAAAPPRKRSMWRRMFFLEVVLFIASLSSLTST